MNDYNAKLCDERHEHIDREFKVMWDKLKTLEGRLWAIIVLLMMNLGGIIAALIKGL